MNLFRANDPISPFGCLCIIIQAASVIALAPMHRIVKNLAETNNRNNQRIIPRKLIYTYPPKNSNGFWRWLTIFWNGPFETRGPGAGGVSYQKKTYGHGHATGFIDCDSHELPDRTHGSHGFNNNKNHRKPGLLAEHPCECQHDDSSCIGFSMHLEDRKIQAKTLTSNVVKVTYFGWRFSIASWMANQIDTPGFLGKETPWEWKKSHAFTRWLFEKYMKHTLIKHSRSSPNEGWQQNVIVSRTARFTIFSERKIPSTSNNSPARQ